MAKQNASAQTSNKAQIQLIAAEKATLTIPASQQLDQAVKAADGNITIKKSMGTLKLVDVADVDLLLTFANGDRVVIPNGAIDAVGKNPPEAIFSDTKISLPELFKLVGVTNPAKAGSLRLVSENIDANPPTDENISRTEYVPDTPPPPAPMLKVGAGQGTGKSLGTGLGDVPQTYTPLVTAQPAVYRVGKSQTNTNSGESFGSPKVTSALYTSSEYKVSYPGMPEPSPQGEYNAALNATTLAQHLSPANQSNVETLIGTSGNDIIEHNTTFSTAETQWSKTLHIGIDNFTSVSAITLDFSANALTVPDFNIVGLDGAIVTQDSVDATKWHVTPTTAMLKNGVNLAIVYSIKDITSPALDTSQIVNFISDITVDGKVGAFNFQVINNLYMTWRDAISQEDFNVTNENGTQYMVLPQRGVGMIINAGDGDDTINAGSGNDVIWGGLGADIVDGGSGNDTVTYNEALTGIVATLSSGLTETNSGDQAAGDSFAANTIENLIGSDYNDILIGDNNKNILDGGDGNDILIGIKGGDTFIGGANDEIDSTYNLATNLQGDTVSYKYATSGISASLSLNKGLTNQALGDTYSGIENLTGSQFSDTLEGDSNANVINGGTNDAGITDYVSYKNSSAGVTVDLSKAGQQESTGDASGDILINIQNVIGTAFDDTFTGNSNILGNKFDGGSGGVNAVSYANSLSPITASLNSGAAITINGITYGTLTANNTGDATKDTFNNIQVLIGTNGNDILTGSYTKSGSLVKDSNTIYGGDGNDQIFTGLIGNANIYGGKGNDIITVTKYLDNRQDVIDGGDDIDTFIFAATPTVYNLDMGKDETTTGTFSPNNIIDYTTGTTLGGLGGYVTLKSIENITILNTNYNGTIFASNVNNIIIANSSRWTNTIDYKWAGKSDLGAAQGVTVDLTVTSGFNVTGGSGNDTISNFDHVNGSDYIDTITGNANANTLQGGNGNDTLSGGSGNDTLVGGSGIDTLNGDNGDDLLKGGADGDKFFGGTGTDTVSYADGGAVTVDTTSTISLVSTLGTGDANGDTFNSIEKFIGSASNDTFILNLGPGSTLPIDINGSGGTDTLKLMGLGGSYSLSAITPISTSNEGLNIKDGVSTVLTISALDLQNFADATRPTITITRDAGDSLTLIGGSNFFSGSSNVGTSLSGSASGTYSVMAGGVELAKVQWVA
jgi:Ca2+-binding RTX toxin-like protein